MTRKIMLDSSSLIRASHYDGPMSDARAIGQKLLPVPVSEKFLQEINAGVKRMGYTSRSQFVRDAIIEKLHRMGVVVAPELAFPPGRIGKGGSISGRGNQPPPVSPKQGTPAQN
jgi:hypothetical protein